MGSPRPESAKKSHITLKMCEEFIGDQPYVVRFSDDYSYAAIGFEHGKIIIKENSKRSQAKKSVGNLTSIGIFDAKDDTTVTDIKFVHINRDQKYSKMLCATYTSGYVRIWRFTRDLSRRMVGEVLEKYIGAPRPEVRGDLNTPLCCSYSYDNRHIVVGGTDAVIRVYNAPELTVARLCKCTNFMGSSDGHLMQVCAISYHPLGAQRIEYLRVFITASWDHTVKIWQDDIEHCLWSYGATNVCSNDALDINSENNLICAGNWSPDMPSVSFFNFNTTVVHNYHSPIFEAKPFASGKAFNKACTKLYRELIMHSSRNYVAKFLSDSIVFLGGGQVDCFNIVEFRTGETLVTVTGFTKTIVSAAIHTNIEDTWYPCSVCLCSDHSVYLFDILKPDKHVVDVSDLKAAVMQE